MKVYFQDGVLDRDWYYRISEAPRHNIHLIDAVNGVTDNLIDLKCFQNIDGDVYTNSPLAIDNKYVWNKELGVPELYVRVAGQSKDAYEWARVDKLTKRELKECHNLLELYLADEFSQSHDVFELD